MKINTRNFFLLLIVVFLIGCDFVDTEPVRKRRSRGGLSGAAKKASDDYSGERVVEEEYKREKKNHHRHHNDCDEDEENETTTSTVDTSLPIESIFIKPYYSNGIMTLNSQTDYMKFGLDFGMNMEKNSVAFDIGMGPVNLLSSNKLTDGFKKDMFKIDLNIGMRKPFTSDHTFLGGHFLFGGGLSILSYRFKNSLKVEDYEGDLETINSDFLTGINIYTGLGGLIFNPEKTKISLDIQAGVILWNETTFQDFENDVFDPSAYLLFKFGPLFEFD